MEKFHNTVTFITPQGREFLLRRQPTALRSGHPVKKLLPVYHLIIRYHTLDWTPPILSQDEEIELGRQIALVGRDHFMREFRKSLKLAKPPPPPTQPPPPPVTSPKTYPALILHIITTVIAWVYLTILVLALIAFILLLIWGLFNISDFTISTREWRYILVKIGVTTAIVSVFVAGHYAISAWLAQRRYSRWIDSLVTRYAAHIARGGI